MTLFISLKKQMENSLENNMFMLVHTYPHTKLNPHTYNTHIHTHTGSMKNGERDWLMTM